MNIEFVATVAVIAPDPVESRNFYVGTLGLPLSGEAGDYLHSESIPGCKSFGSGRSRRRPRHVSG